jgi:hypothetical protein
VLNVLQGFALKQDEKKQKAVHISQELMAILNTYYIGAVMALMTTGRVEPLGLAEGVLNHQRKKALDDHIQREAACVISL